MKKFVAALLTNRFGIVLATLNVCYFAFNGFNKIHHTIGNFHKIMWILHVPATILAGVSLKIVEFIFSVSNIFSYRQILSVTFLFFVTLQWLFVAWIAKTAAQKIQAIRS